MTMLLRLLFTGALTLAASPALAHAPAGHRAGDPVPAGCVRAHAHVPSGKIAHAPAPIRCAEVMRVAAPAGHPRASLMAPRATAD